MAPLLAALTSVLLLAGPALAQSSIKPISASQNATVTRSLPRITASAAIVPNYNHPAATTSLPGVANATATASASAAHPPLPSCKTVQHNFPSGSGGNAEQAEAIKEMYRYAFNAYSEYAFGEDELQPLTKTPTQDWYGWGVTIVDGLDTAIVMNLTDIVTKMLGYIETIDFTTTPDGPVEMFDVTIRYLGGLLSSYDLIKSGQFYTGYNATQVEALLSQAVVLADKLAYGFNTPTGISAVDVDFNTNTPVEGTYTTDAGVTYNSTNTASAGTFLIEFYRLADLTGNHTYRELVDKGEAYLVNPNPKPVYPGLVGTQFDTTAGGMLNFAGGWHSTVDSFMEYLIKIFHYRPDNITAEYANFWIAATKSTAEYLALHPYNFPDLTFISELDDSGDLTYTMDDYSCFAGGNFLLGCKVLGIESLCDLGVAAADGCHQTYNTTTTGLGSLYWGWYAAQNNSYPPDPTVDIDAGYRGNGGENGYFIVEGNEDWASYPESIESWFYAYRITGDARWQEYSWQVAQAINATARNSVAFATVNNVDMPHGGSQSNNLDSFFFAEVLKYLYLTQADPSVIDLGRYVFNTECHPVFVQCEDGGWKGNMTNAQG